MNLAFLSGNEIAWKTRWEPSMDGTNTPYRTLVCYKESVANAAATLKMFASDGFRSPRSIPL